MESVVGWILRKIGICKALLWCLPSQSATLDPLGGICEGPVQLPWGEGQGVDVHRQRP